jgi:hypothetical protein
VPDTSYPARGAVDVFVPPGTRIASGEGAPVAGFGSATMLRARLDISALSGTGVDMELVLEDSLDDGQTWGPVAAFVRPVTEASLRRQSLDVSSPFGPLLRARWTITGSSPAVTFSLVVMSK